MSIDILSVQRRGDGLTEQSLSATAEVTWFVRPEAGAALRQAA